MTDVLPAQAGVILICRAWELNELGTPRASGGDPEKTCTLGWAQKYSPRKRG